MELELLWGFQWIRIMIQNPFIGAIHPNYKQNMNTKRVHYNKGVTLNKAYYNNTPLLTVVSVESFLATQNWKETFLCYAKQFS